jgi:hypothetical protein
MRKTTCFLKNVHIREKQRRFEMKTHTRIGLMVLVALVLLLAWSIPAMAKKPADFTISYDLLDVNWENNYGEGTFDAEGVIQVEDGDVIAHWIPRIGAKQGTMIFKDGANGNFYIRYTLSKYEGDDCGSGHFEIQEFRGTGDYEGMWGNGDFTMCRPGGGDDIHGDLTGWANFEDK